MNAKIERVNKEIDKTRGKIGEFQTRLRDLEKQKTELENMEIVEAVRNMSIPFDELAVLLQSVKNGGMMSAPTSGHFVQKPITPDEKEEDVE